MRDSTLSAVGALALGFCALPAAASTPVGDPAAGLQAMRELNLIVLGDLTANGQEVEGKTFVGGNLSGSGTNWGNGNGSQGAAASDRRTLTVNGNNGNSGSINNNSNGGAGLAATVPGMLIGGNSVGMNLNTPGMFVDVGGNLGGNYNVGSGQTFNIGGNATGSMNGTNGATVNAGGSLGGNANGAVFNANLGIGWNAASTSLKTAAELAKLDADLTALSQALTGLTLASNPSSITIGGQGPTFNAVTGGNSFVLFNTAYDPAWNEINFNVVGGGVPIIVNVSGTNIVWDTNPVGGFNSSLNQNIIWNFFEATTIQFMRQVQGSILAPGAAISNETPLEGSVVARSMTMNGEVHLGTFDGDLIFAEPVPEPATWAMMILGFGAVGLVARRRGSRPVLSA